MKENQPKLSVLSDSLVPAATSQNPVITPVTQGEKASWANVVAGPVSVDLPVQPSPRNVTVSSGGVLHSPRAAVLPHSGGGVLPSVSKSSSCKMVKIDFEGIIDEVHFWESAVICFVLGANPHLHVMEGYVKRIWKDLSIDKIVMVA